MDENKITLNGRDYPLAFTTKATKEITEKFGGLNKMFETLKDENQSIEITCWLTACLANQVILRNNLFEQKRDPLLTAEMVEVASTPADLKGFIIAVKNTIVRDSKRNVESEEDPKN